MPIQLEISDGVPYWWDSPDIWVVPGNDPNGDPDQPVAGQPAFLWAQVQNIGNQNASGAQVNFYWSNPAAGVLRSNSTLVGSAFVDLGPGETKDVLCVIPWIPVIVNDGHECVVAEVIHTGDPLPAPVPDAFDPPTYRQVAQKNLNVLAMSLNMMIRAIQIGAPPREDRRLRIGIERGEQLDKKLLARLGLARHRFAPRAQVTAWLSHNSDCEPAEKKPPESVTYDVKRGTVAAVFLKVMPAKLDADTYAVLRVVARSGEKVMGGVTYVLVNAGEK
jgi:hypothetical protein